MPLIEINSAVVYRLVFAELQTALAAAGVALLPAHDDDPGGQAAFVRLHPIVEEPGRTMPGDADTRRMLIRATAQVSADALAADGYALINLAHTVKVSLAGSTISGDGHRVVIERGRVDQQPAQDDLLAMRDAQIDWAAYAERLTGND